MDFDNKTALVEYGHKHHCIGFAWQTFISGATGVAPVKAPGRSDRVDGSSAGHS